MKRSGRAGHVDNDYGLASDLGNQEQRILSLRQRDKSDGVYRDSTRPRTSSLMPAAIALTDRHSTVRSSLNEPAEMMASP